MMEMKAVGVYFQMILYPTLYGKSGV